MILVVANRKGGTGKTTTVVNLASEWGKSGYKTLIIDLDTQGHAGLGLGCDDRRGEGVHKIFSDSTYNLQGKVVSTKIENVSVLLADSSFVLGGQIVASDTLKIKLHEAGILNTFDKILIDTPPTLDQILLNALVAADGVLVPFIPHYLSLVGIKQLIKVFYHISTTINPQLETFSLLPVMTNCRYKMHQKIMEQVEIQFGRGNVLRGVRSNIKLAEAFMQGTAINRYAPRSAGAMDYCLLAETLADQYSCHKTLTTRG